MNLFVDFVLLILGAVLILGGANYFTAGASAVAKKLGVSDFVIGLTLVAIGSSAPDLAVGVFSALKGHTQFALGNVVGSCLFDGLLVVGFLALMKPFKMSDDLIKKQIPYMLIAYLVILICANAFPHVITRADGLLMILFFGLILWQELSQKPSTPTNVTQNHLPKWSSKTIFITAIEIAGGLGALIGGGDIFVKGAAGIASHAHISETVIGLTVVALGTSLPDLATSAVAAYKNRMGMAIGNVVGSCMMDALLVLGCSAVTAPLPMGGVNNFDLLMMLGSGILLMFFSLCRRSHVINRWEGGFLIAVYAFYIIMTVINR